MGARRGGGPKISRFFFSPTGNFILSSLSGGGLLVEFWWCLKHRGAQMCTFGFSGAAGVSHDNQRNHEKTHSEREKERNWWWEREKKARNFGPSTLRGPTLRAPTPPGPRPLRAPNPSGPHPFGPPPPDPPTAQPAHHPTTKKKWPNVVWPNAVKKLAKCGQIRLAKCGQLSLAKCGMTKFGLAKCGQIRMTKPGLAKCGRDQ